MEKFLLKNRLEYGDHCQFKLIRNGGILRFKLLNSLKKQTQLLDRQFVTFHVTEESFDDGKQVTFRRLYLRFFMKAFKFPNYKKFVQNIPIYFTRANSLINGRMVTWVDKNGKTKKNWKIWVNAKKVLHLEFYMETIMCREWRKSMAVYDIGVDPKKMWKTFTP